jgi:hypothetical protein
MEHLPVAGRRAEIPASFSNAVPPTDTHEILLRFNPAGHGNKQCCENDWFVLF